jgi:hypothetical protein
MPPPLPDRYRLEIRLGRNGDLEEWLATDSNLDRPVLIRILGPDATPERKAQFLASVSGASAVTHPHLEQVFAADEVPNGAFAVGEWAGGLTLGGRVNAGITMDPTEFISNAAGLAAALAALHESGVIHGAIDLDSISYTVSHPAKLGGFGRPPRSSTSIDDVIALAGVLEHSLTGSPGKGPPPSQVIDGISTEIDRVLRWGGSGAASAKQLAEAFGSAPTPAPALRQAEPGPVRGLGLAAALVGLAAGLVILGRVLATPGAPAVFPLIPSNTATTPAAVTTSSVPPTTSPIGAVTILGAATFDPFGEGGENDGRVGLIVDGDSATQWRTERYLDPLPLLKAGVGVTVEVAGSPRTIELVGLTPGTAFQLLWSSDRPADPATWERIVDGRSAEGIVDLRIPARPGGFWLIWLIDLPPTTDGYLAFLAEVRFGS